VTALEAAAVDRAARRREVAALPADCRIVEGDGVRLHVLSYGGGGPDVVVLPGITSPAITWDFVARRLAHSARLHVVDLRGRGLSDEASGYALAHYASDAIALVRSMALDRPILLGHSLGARIAAAAAVREPGLAGGLVLVDPPLSGRGREPYPTTLDAFLTQLHEAQAGTTAAQVQRHYPHWPHAELALRARWLPTCSEQAVVETHAGFESDDFFDDWRRLEPPLALLHGAESPVVTREGAREAEKANPAARLIEIPNAGHMVPWDNLEGFLSAVRPLLSMYRAPSSLSTEPPSW
jgi:N-formylmaleamate deformylase